MSIESGEVWLVRFPFTDLTSTKLRPAVVWTVFGEDAIVVGIFSRMPPGPPRKTWVLIEEQREDFDQTGLAKTSLVKAEKLATIHCSVLQRKLGRLSPGLLESVGAALKIALRIQ